MVCEPEMITFNVCKLGQFFGIQVADSHADRTVTLPNGSTERMGNLHGTTIHLSPTGRVGVPVTMPDSIRASDEPTNLTRYKNDEPADEEAELFGEAA